MLSNYLENITKLLQNFRQGVNRDLDGLAASVEGAFRESMLNPKTRLFNEQVLNANCVQAGKDAETNSLLVFGDVNGMKGVNDSGGGHLAGDAVLQRIASRLLAVAGDFNGFAYHQSGDEFALLIPLPVDDPANKIKSLKRELVRSFKTVEVWAGEHEAKVSMSFGGFVFDSVVDSQTALLNADLALRSAKAEDADTGHGGTLVVWDAETALPEYVDMRKKCKACGSTVAISVKKDKYAEGESFSTCTICGKDY